MLTSQSVRDSLLLREDDFNQMISDYASLVKTLQRKCVSLYKRGLLSPERTRILRDLGVLDQPVIPAFNPVNEAIQKRN
jgi:hypothetical protein